MEASRVTIKQALLENKLGKKGKARLRVEAIKTHIRNKPAGTKFGVKELITAAGYTDKQYGTGWAFVQRLIRDKVIAINDFTPGKFKQEYFIPNDGIIQQAKKLDEEDAQVTVKDDKMTVPKDDGVIQPKGILSHLYSKDEIVSLAKQYAWNTNDDSLRAFIATLQ